MATLSASIKLKDQFSSTLNKAAGGVNKLNGRFKDVNNRISSVTSKMKILGHMTIRPVIKVKDMATSTIGKIKSNLLSLNGIAAMALAGVGLNSLGNATVGQAMDFEQQQVSMLHWLKGNQKAANDATSWLEQFAAVSPFTMTDLFPAMTRGIGVADGDLATAKKLVTLSSDMAALTPGKTVQDAMEALADAQMGEFERMKEFGMKMTQEEFKALGGFNGFINKAQGKFAKGAEKLSKTTRGYISTITDTIGTLFRNTGTGILESLKPRLEKITAWFDSHQETVKRWKDNLITFGRQGAEGVLSMFEGIFTHIKTTYLDNPTFNNLSLKGKIDFIMADIGKVFDDWLASGGQATLTGIGQNIGAGIGAGLESMAPGIASSFYGVFCGFIRGLFTKENMISVLKAGFTGAPIISTSKPPGKALGMPYVPYDNYPALLHRGETVLDRADADQHRKGSKSGGGNTYTVIINGYNRSTDDILSEMENKLLGVAANMGGV